MALMSGSLQAWHPKKKKATPWVGHRSERGGEGKRGLPDAEAVWNAWETKAKNEVYWGSNRLHTPKRDTTIRNRRPFVGILWGWGWEMGPWHAVQKACPASQ